MNRKNTQQIYELFILEFEKNMDFDDFQIFINDLEEIVSKEAREKNNKYAIGFLQAIAWYIYDQQVSIYKKSNRKKFLFQKRSRKEKNEYIKRKAKCFLDFLDEQYFTSCFFVSEEEDATEYKIKAKVVIDDLKVILRDMINNPQRYNPSNYSNERIMPKQELRNIAKKITPKPKNTDIEHFLTYTINLIPIRKIDIDHLIRLIH